jgi:tRNA (guanine-N7-)-methyltransferase
MTRLWYYYIWVKIMRLKNVKNKNDIIEKCNYIVKQPEQYKGNWNKLFNNNNYIYIEIGMGKGQFIIENAIKCPNINFIGIEKYDSVIARASQKANEYELKNLRLIRYDAINIEKIFDHEINRIYLNFSDPWPKKRHAKRRLTSDVFLSKYDKVFKNKKEIYQKTDNMLLFEYSIESLSQYGYKLKNISLDLHNSDYQDNIMTEYEQKFNEQKVRINRLEAYKD